MPGTGHQRSHTYAEKFASPEWAQEATFRRISPVERAHELWTIASLAAKSTSRVSLSAGGLLSCSEDAAAGDASLRNLAVVTLALSNLTVDRTSTGPGYS